MGSSENLIRNLQEMRRTTHVLTSPPAALQVLPTGGAGGGALIASQLTNWSIVLARPRRALLRARRREQTEEESRSGVHDPAGPEA